MPALLVDMNNEESQMVDCETRGGGGIVRFQRHIMRPVDAERDGLNTPKYFLGELLLSKLSMRILAWLNAMNGAAALSSLGSGFVCALFVGDPLNHLDYGADVMVPEAILDAAL